MKILKFILTLFMLPSFIFTADITKVGVYDFNAVIKQMAEEPILREMFPLALQENLYITLMLEYLTEKKPLLTNKSFNEKVNANAQYFAKKKLLKAFNKQVDSYKKSNDIRDLMIKGISFAQTYRGFNFILKPHEKILYSNTDLDWNIAISIAEDEESKKKLKEAIE